MKCPHCQKEISETLIHQEAARIMVRKRAPFKNWMTHEQAVGYGKMGATAKKLNEERRRAEKLRQPEPAGSWDDPGPNWILW